MIRPASSTRWHTHHIPRSVSLAAPSVRMVVIEAWANQNADGSWTCSHHLHPILALAAETRDEYSHPAKPSGTPRKSPDHAELERFGWGYEHTQTSFDAVVLDVDYGLVEASQAFDGLNVAYETVLAPWPVSEDRERLAEVIARLEQEAQAKACRHQRQPFTPELPKHVGG